MGKKNSQLKHYLKNRKKKGFTLSVPRGPQLPMENAYRDNDWIENHLMGHGIRTIPDKAFGLW